MGDSSICVVNKAQSANNARPNVSGNGFPGGQNLFKDFADQLAKFLETNEPMNEIALGKAVEHVDRWVLHRQALPAELNNAGLGRGLLPLVEATGSKTK